jgi:protein involved in polysaccharide export with SLBB domain
VDLKGIIKNKSSISDLLVQSGDTLFIPKKLETVRLRGHLLNPTTLRHQKNKSTKYYISNAGGFKARADKSKTYVIYPNGEARATKKFLFFNIYPQIVAGSEIRVPEKLPRKPSTGVGALTGVFTGVATLVLAITQLNL